MRWTIVALAFLMGACGGSQPASNAAPDSPATGSNQAPIGGQPSANPRHESWPDELKIAEHVALIRLETFWKGAVTPAKTTDESLLAVCIDQAGKYYTRRKGEDWKPRTDPDLLHTLRLFGEESVDGESMRSNCQVVLGADKNAPMSNVLGVLEMLSQARIARPLLLTQERANTTLLLEIGSTDEATESVALLVLSRNGETIVARLVDDKTSSARWGEELASFVDRRKESPNVLAVSASTLTMLDVETALNACWKLGMKRVKFVF
jgi:biopolymer transport protein ExbD